MEKHPHYQPAAEFNHDIGHTWANIRALDADSALFVKDLYSSASDIIDGLKEIIFESVSENSQIMRRHTDLLGQLAISCQ